MTIVLTLDGSQDEARMPRGHELIPEGGAASKEARESSGPVQSRCQQILFLYSGLPVISLRNQAIADTPRARAAPSPTIVGDEKLPLYFGRHDDVIRPNALEA